MSMEMKVNESNYESIRAVVLQGGLVLGNLLVTRTARGTKDVYLIHGLVESLTLHVYVYLMTSIQ